MRKFLQRKSYAEIYSSPPVGYWIFGLLGPFVGFSVFLSFGGGFKSHAFQSFLMLLPVAYLVGLIPALITAAFDRGVVRRGARGLSRCLLTGLFGFAVPYLLVIENAFETTPMVPTGGTWGLIGAIPALLCAWITDKLDNYV